MAIKKSELYGKIWNACDELRGGMDPSEYKNYILVLLFIKYVSDKYAGKPYESVQVPEGATFDDLVRLKNQPNIGDDINKKILGPLFQANRLTNPPDFNDSEKLGRNNEKVERLSKLIGIFQDPNLDFSGNGADGDDLLGDAYEYLMRHFATESGKSKGQFYTPTEVSRTMAEIIGIRTAKTTAQTTVYDPTCGSGSLLLRVAAAARTKVSIYGQEKDGTTSGLARMNMILHEQPTAEIRQDNTLAAPAYLEGEKLKKFDYVVANPPFSDKRWTTDVRIEDDPYNRFAFGAPPNKQGDYAYLLHILTSLKSTGTGVCVLPHGVLFRGNSEGAIRQRLVKEGYIKVIIGLPANLFYGTSIPACLIVLDKVGAKDRTAIFMIDASAGFMKDGPKNRLRAQDIHKIADAFNRRLEVPRYSRMVPFEEIEKNDFNLNLPRYIDSQVPDDIQDIAGHLQGGIPVADVDALSRYWAVCPQLREALLKPNRPGYVDLAVDKAAIKNTIYSHPEFTAFIAKMNAHFADWRTKSATSLKSLKPGFHPKAAIPQIAEDLLAHYAGNPLIDPYAVYQHLMDYSAETMQDDCYIVAADGWKAQTYSVIVTDKKGKKKDKGWTCDLVPKSLIVARYFAKEQGEIDDLTAAFETTSAQLAELTEEHSTEGGALDLDLKRAEVSARLKEIAKDKEARDEAAVLKSWLDLNAQETHLKKRLKDAEAALDAAAYAKYPDLSESEIKMLVVDDKWLATLDARLHGEMDRVSQQLAQRVRDLGERYANPLPRITETIAALGSDVNRHLKRMGLSWN